MPDPPTPPDPPPPPGAPREESAVTGTLWALVAQLATSAVTGVVLLYLVRELGKEGFGELSLALSVGAIGLLLADAALSHSAGRFMADRRGDRGRVVEVVAAALRLKLITAGVIGVGLAVLADPIASVYGKPDLVWPLRAVAVALAAESLLLLWLAVFASLRRQQLSARTILAESVVEGTATIGLVLLGAGVTGAAAGRAVGYVFGAVFGAVVVARLLGRGVFAVRGSDRETRGRIRSYARPLFATNSAYTAYATIDMQLIGLLLSSSAVGLFAAPLRLTTFVSHVGQSVANAVAPRMSLEAPGGPDVRSFTAGVRWLLVLHMAIVVPLVVWAEPIVVLLLDDEFRDATDVLIALAPFVLLRGISPLIATTVNYLGEAGRRLPIVLVSLAVNAAIDLALLPVIGPPAAAIGTSVAYCIYVPAHLRICRQKFDVPLRPLGLTLARSLAAGAAFAAVLLLLGREDLSAGEWLAGLLLGPLAYAAVLLVTGEVTRSHLRAARSTVGGRWR